MYRQNPEALASVREDLDEENKLKLESFDDYSKDLDSDDSLSLNEIVDNAIA